jgi:hypothetical protein
MDYEERLASLRYFVDCFNSVTGRGPISSAASELLTTTITAKHRNGIDLLHKN